MGLKCDNAIFGRNEKVGKELGQKKERMKQAGRGRKEVHKKEKRKVGRKEREKEGGREERKWEGKKGKKGGGEGKWGRKEEERSN